MFSRMRRECSTYSDVLIVDAGESAVGRLIEGSLRRKGLRVSSCENVRRLNEKDFIAQIKEQAARERVGTIIPVFHPELLSRHRDEFPGVIIPVDSEDRIVMLDDKLRACALASSLGIRQPGMFPDVDSVHSYPVVFKRSSGHGGDSVYFPKLRRSLEHLVGSSKPGTYLISEEIEGCDVSVDAVRWGDYFQAGAYEVLLPKAKGISILRRSIDAPEIVETARRMLEAAGYNGVCGLDFRRDSDGNYYFLECNPRFSGGLCSQLASGFDMPWILWQLSHGIQPDEVHFKAGVRTQYIKGTVDYLKRRHRQGKLTAGDVLRCIFSGAVKFD